MLDNYDLLLSIYGGSVSVEPLGYGVSSSDADLPMISDLDKELHLSNSGDENEEDQENPTSSTPSRGTQDDEAQTAADLAETSLPVGEKENDDPSKTPKTPKKI